MHRIAAKFIPWLLTNDQKRWCINMCLELWEKANEDPTFPPMSGIIMGDKSRIYGYPETKQQSSQWKSPRSPRAIKARQIQRSTESMLVFFFFFHLAWMGLFTVPPNTTVISDIYCEMLEKKCAIEKDRNFGTTTTGSITTTHPPTRSWKPQSLWLRTTWLSFPILPTCQT
jgi:hypothetical protein